MENKSRAVKIFRQILPVWGIYTLYALVIFIQSYTAIIRYTGPNRQTLRGALLHCLVLGYTWAMLTPLITKIGRRLPVSGKKIFRNVFLHLLIGFLFAAVHRAVFFVFVWFHSPNLMIIPVQSTHQALWFVNYVLQDLFEYIIIAAIYQAYLNFRESQDREFRLQQAELQTLKTQLHPHFLFNTLNAISSLVSSSPKTAQTTIAQLSDLLRVSLKDNRTQEIPLKDELDFTRKYVQIQQTLLQERLRVEWNIEPDTLDALVPNLILQPLVENSIRHGIAPKESGGSIQINVRRENNALRLVLIDDGLGFSSNKNEGSSVGLTNTRTRLQYLYGDSHEFELCESINGGVTANIKIPFRVNKKKTDYENKNADRR